MLIGRSLAVDLTADDRLFIQLVAAAKGEDASEWGRAIIETELRRDLAALQLRDQLQAAKPGNLPENVAMDLVNEAKRVTRSR